MNQKAGWGGAGGATARPARATMGGMARRDAAAQKGFTLIEVLIAMSILAVGAASILAIFVWAIAFQTRRHEENRLKGIYNHALTHARASFNQFDPMNVPKGQPLLPRKIVADLRDPQAARASPDKMIRDAAEKFPGFQYMITFADNDLAVPGSSVVVDIEIRGLSGERDESSHKWVLTRDTAPLGAWFHSPSMDERDKKKGP
jgi:prepilin-type N-terminal cleavage/methylation domain-containing protein